MSLAELSALVGQWGAGDFVAADTTLAATSTFSGTTAIGTPATMTVTCALPTDGVYEIDVAVAVRDVKRRHRAVWCINADGGLGAVVVTGPAGNELQLPPFPTTTADGKHDFYPAMPRTLDEARATFANLAGAIAACC